MHLRSFYRAAVAMPQNYDQRHIEFHNRVFNAAFYDRAGAVHHVAGNSHNEYVSLADIEQDFRCHARIGTANNRRERVLRLGKLPKIGWSPPWTVRPSAR